MPEDTECKSKLSSHPELEPKQFILLVEDEEYVREVAREILRLQGYCVIEANGPHEALERYEQHGAEIDLLLTDIVMPGMDGPDLAERLTQRQPSIKSIFMSGYTENALRRGALELAAGYLQKPFTLKALVDKVHEVLARPNQPMAAETPVSGIDRSQAPL
jgi:CheY-like chemotaxis protein